MSYLRSFHLPEINKNSFLERFRGRVNQVTRKGNIKSIVQLDFRTRQPHTSQEQLKHNQRVDLQTLFSQNPNGKREQVKLRENTQFFKNTHERSIQSKLTMFSTPNVKKTKKLMTVNSFDGLSIQNQFFQNKLDQKGSDFPLTQKIYQGNKDFYDILNSIQNRKPNLPKTKNTYI